MLCGAVATDPLFTFWLIHSRPSYNPSPAKKAVKLTVMPWTEQAAMWATLFWLHGPARDQESAKAASWMMKRDLWPCMMILVLQQALKCTLSIRQWRFHWNWHKSFSLSSCFRSHRTFKCPHCPHTLYWSDSSTCSCFLHLNHETYSEFYAKWDMQWTLW